MSPHGKGDPVTGILVGDRDVLLMALASLAPTNHCGIDVERRGVLPGAPRDGTEPGT